MQVIYPAKVDWKLLDARGTSVWEVQRNIFRP